eukprot:403336284
MIVYILLFVALISLVVLPRFFKKQEANESIPKQEHPQNKQQKQEIKESSLQKAKEDGVSFKQLKSQSKGGKKKSKGGSNPEHPAYVAGVKGFNSAVVDFDYYNFKDGAILMVIAEENSVIKAVITRNIDKEEDYIQASQKLQAGQNLISITVGPSLVTDSKKFSMIIAIAVFDHCSVVFQELSFADNKLKFTPLIKQMVNIHKMPVRQIRLSKKNPNLIVSCGDESDVTVKLWNIAGSLTEPVSSINTSQIKHKYMTQGQDLDYFAVAAKTTDTRIYQIVYNQGVMKGLEKVISLTHQKKEVLSVCFDQLSKYCVSTAKDQQMIIYQIDDYYKQAKLMLQQQITTLDDLTLSSSCVVETSKNISYLFVAFANGQNVEVYQGTVAHDMKPLVNLLRIEDAQLDNISQIQLFYDISKEEVFLITSARQDFRVNVWKVPFQV